ncbi:MAG: hypothetical protein M0P71_01110 [Melioribacteraceae bacterium]|nr:hypothetical protein [Melioribacteraceae bacterium]
MITENMIYWITRLDAICMYLSIMSIISGVLFILITIGYVCSLSIASEEIEKENIGKSKKIWTYTLIIFLSSFTILIFIPTTKEMATIKILPMVANSEFVQNKLPKETEELYNIAKEYFKEQFNKNKTQEKK